MPESTPRQGRALQVLATIAAPLLMLLFCGALLVLCGIRPYERLKTYLNIAFMDTQRIDDVNAGLIIKEKDIQTEYAGETDSEGTVIYPNFGEQYAVLKSEAISLNVPLYWGTNSALLEKGACQTAGSKVVGEVGNAVIDAHVNTFFADLHKLKEGDEVMVYTDYGTFLYEVDRLVRFDKADKTYVFPTEEERLTLYTCVADVLGSSTERVGVLCKVKEKHFYQSAAGGENKTE